MKKHNTDWQKIYYWELKFKSGRIFDQRVENSLPKQDRIDPQNPPIKFGQAEFIRLVPGDELFPPIQIAIPSGSFPVYFRRIVSNSIGVVQSLEFVIGWNLNGVRNMKIINAETRQETSESDKKGIKI